MRTSLAVVLAAGVGKRMKSGLPKVLHPIGGQPMLLHVLSAVEPATDRIVVVASPSSEAAIAKCVDASSPGTAIAVQKEQRGTGDAVKAARGAFVDADDIVVVFGDTPFLSPETIARVRAKLAEGAAIVVTGMQPAVADGYGRLVMDGAQLVAIREHRDASEAERAIGFVNGGVMAFDGASALDILSAIEDRNDQSEFYLTDAVEIANKRGLRVEAIEVAEDELMGINDRQNLAAAEQAFQAKRRAQAMDEGATLIAPDTVFFSHDTVIGRDVVIEPYVYFGPGVTVGDGVTIHSFSHFVGATIAAGAEIGPFARFRPGAEIGEGARIGNFVEIKQSVVGKGAKINHLTYIGDATVGAGTNVGAGTIVCNYDGFFKYRTEIGERAFIGSNSSLVAPLTIGDDAYIGSGSVITKDVAAGALAVERTQQVEKGGWVERFRQRMTAKKKAV